MEMKNIRIFAQWTRKNTRKNIDIGEKSFYAIFVKDKKILFKRIHTYESLTKYNLRSKLLWDKNC